MVGDKQINLGYFKIQQKCCDSVTILHFAVVGISILSSLSALGKVLISKEARSSSDNHCISSFTSMLLILSNISVLWSSWPRRSHGCMGTSLFPPNTQRGWCHPGRGPGTAPRRPLQWGVRSTRGSSCFWVGWTSTLAASSGKILRVTNPLCQERLHPGRTFFPLKGWGLCHMFVSEHPLLLGEVKHFQACCVSAQGVQGSCRLSQLLGQPRHLAHSHLSLSPQLSWPKCCRMKVCSMGQCVKGQFPTVEWTDKADRTTEQF